jgi:hypothetical protein
MITDTTQGIWLESERLDDGTFDYWMTINGKRIDLSRDDFLAMHTADKEIREKERERIIKLLEDYIPTFYELSANTDEGKYPIEHLIDLIKGEQK